MNNIVIGQYVPGKSFIYKIDPRIKISGLILLMVTTFLLNSFILMSIMFALVFLLFLVTRVPIMKMLRGLKPLMFLLTFTFFIQILATKQTPDATLLYEHQMDLGLFSTIAIVLIAFLYFWLKKYIKFSVLYFFLMVFLAFFVQAILPQYSYFTYTLKIFDQALLRTGFVIVRIIIIVVLSSLLTFTTLPTDITNGLESLLKPLKIIKFPVGELAMMFSLTLRFIPTLLEETNKIMKAQASRGVEFSESRFKDKIVQIISLLIPIFVVSFKRAEELANAMDVRGYIVGGKRTKIDVLKMHFKDYFAIFVVVLLLVVSILLRVGVFRLAL